MSLDDIVSNVETEVEREEYNPLECPSCGKEGEETEYWYNRCTTPSDECDVLIFIPVEPREKVGELVNGEIRF